jgi:hypothetical protein
MSNVNALFDSSLKKCSTYAFMSVVPLLEANSGTERMATNARGARVIRLLSKRHAPKITARTTTWERLTESFRKRAIYAVEMPPVSESSLTVRSSGGNHVSPQRIRNAAIDAVMKRIPLKKRLAGSFRGNGTMRKSAKSRFNWNENRI